MKRKINLFDKIGTLIPEYKGYVERDSRRECDRQLKEYIVEKISDFEKKINSSIQDIDFYKLVEIDKMRKKINTLKSVIRYSPYGASALFSDSEIKNGELENIYQIDLEILETTEKLASKDISLDSSEINNLIDFIESLIKKRKHYLINI